MWRFIKVCVLLCSLGACSSSAESAAGAVADPTSQRATDTAGSSDSLPTDTLAADTLAADTLALDTAAQPSCNGSPLLCDRPLNQVAFAASHNAMSAADEGWGFANQPHGMIRQLDDGIRALLIDLHPYDLDDGKMPLGETALCHGFCALGSLRWSEATAQIAGWLSANPRELLVFIVEDHVPVAAIASGLDQAGLISRVYAHPPGAAWPSLGQLIDQGKNLVIMTESSPQPGAPPWQHGYHDILFDNPYAAEKVQDFSCELLRGKPDHALALINHFLTKGLEKHDALAQLANTEEALWGQVDKCRKQWKRQINFVAVDWYTTGPLMSVVRRLNGLELAK
jgi:hypothetical protein